VIEGSAKRQWARNQQNTVRREERKRFGGAPAIKQRRWICTIYRSDRLASTSHCMDVGFSMATWLEDADTWRKYAVDLRRLAACAEDPEIKQRLLEIAERYEALAERAEKLRSRR
jgi:hypothetical protein